MVISQKVIDSTGKKSTETMTYIQNGNYLKTHTDSMGNVTTYYYDNNDMATKGLVTSVKDPEGNITTYTYDADTDELLSVSGDANSTTTTTTEFTTQGTQIKAIEHNDEVYSYDYDEAYRVLASKINGQALVTNSYDTRQRLAQQTYANGDVYTPVYDSQDCLEGEKWSSTQISEYYYNNLGRLSQFKDNVTDVTYRYDYAFYDLPFRITGSDDSKTAYDYDKSGQLSHFAYSENDDGLEMLPTVNKFKMGEHINCFCNNHPSKCACTCSVCEKPCNVYSSDGYEFKITY